METPDDVLKARSYRLLRKNAICRTIAFLIVTAVVLLVLLSIFGVALVNRTSMEPTLHTGDVVLIKKTANKYRVGDIIVYRTLGGQKNVKRIVAVSGDTVDISDNGDLIINGKIKEEPEIYAETYKKDTDIEYPFTVDEGTVFLLGDNRAHSIDSRDTGAVCTTRIIGKVLLSVEAVE